jgi:hypothetical protein
MYGGKKKKMAGKSKPLEVENFCITHEKQSFLKLNPEYPVLSTSSSGFRPDAKDLVY